MKKAPIINGVKENHHGGVKSCTVDRRYHGKQSRKTACTKIYPLKRRSKKYTKSDILKMVMLAGTGDHLTQLSPVILTLESTGLTHLESEIRVILSPRLQSGVRKAVEFLTLMHCMVKRGLL